MNFDEALQLVDRSIDSRIREEAEKEKMLLSVLFDSKDQSPFAASVFDFALSEISKRNIQMHPIASQRESSLPQRTNPMHTSRQILPAFTEKLGPNEEISGIVLRKARTNKGYTGKELSFKIGSSQSYISQIENGYLNLTSRSRFYTMIRSLLEI